MAKATVNESAGAYLKRSLTGTTFLALEYTLHKVLLIVVAALMAAGLASGLGMWLGSTTTSMADSWLGTLAQTSSMSAIMIVAALLVFSPWLVVLDRRVRAEMVKRPGFEGRVAYKLPLYTAMGVVALVKLGIAVAAVWVLLYSLATMGQASAEVVGQMYRDQFVPALKALVVFGLVGWYLLRLSQGRVMRRFSGMFAFAGLLLAVALFITATVNIQNNKSLNPQTTPSLEDYLQDYNSSDKDFLDSFKY